MKTIITFLFLCFGWSLSLTAQQNEFQDSRSFLGISAGTLLGLDGRFDIEEHWFACFQGGYFFEKGGLGGAISLGYSWRVGLVQRNQLYTSFGYLSNTYTNYIGAVAKFGYRFQFGQSPFFLYTEWQPWLDEGFIFRPLAGQVTLSLAFKARERRRPSSKMNGIYNTAIGVKMGTLAGISLRRFTAPRGAIQVELDYDFINKASSFSITYGYNQPIGSAGFFAYGSGGGGYQVVRKMAPNGEVSTEVDGFMAFVLGCEYNIFAFPLQVGLQWEPRYAIERGLKLTLLSLVMRRTF